MRTDYLISLVDSPITYSAVGLEENASIPEEPLMLMAPGPLVDTPIKLSQRSTPRVDMRPTTQTLRYIG